MTSGTVAGHATSTRAGDEGLVEQVVVFHVYTWRTLRPASLGTPGTFNHHRAYRGQHIWVSPEERTRGQNYGALADVGQEDAAVAAVDALAGPASDDELSAMTAEELVAYVTQNGGEAQRVYEHERERSRPRVTVIRAAGYDPETGDRLPPESPHPADDGDPSSQGPHAVG